MKHSQIVAAALIFALPAAGYAQTVKSGIEAWQKFDYGRAVKIWRPLAEKGDADAQFNLAQAYRLGRGVPLNLAAAQTWLQRAAGKGHLDAQTTLGLLLFQNGDRTAGVRWLKGAAEKGEPRAMLVYGTALFNGDAVRQDTVHGYAYVRNAAAQGLAPAVDTLAQMERTMSAGERAAVAKLAAKPAVKAASKTAPASVKVAPPKPAQPSTAVHVADSKSDRSTAAKPAAPAASGWRIQLGAFSKRSSAEGLFKSLSGSGPLYGRSPSYPTVGAVTRLQVGPFASKAAATQACEALGVLRQACFAVPAK